MQLKKLALLLIIATLFFGLILKRSRNRAQQPVLQTTPPPAVSPALKSALEELRVMKIKIDGGINPKEYSEDIADLVHIVENADGDPQVLAAVKSALAGHELAIKFWQCDRISGYDQLYQCRDQVLKAVFLKYPDIATQAQQAVAQEHLSYISAGLDKDSVLQAIWQKTGTDTETALQASYPVPLQNQP